MHAPRAIAASPPEMTSLYHEKQLSSLCGVHALNNLLQGPHFGAGDLAAIALRLDEDERKLLDEPSITAADLRTHRIDQNTGDFSIDVLFAALDQHNIQLITADHASVAEAVASAPEAEEGYLVHRSSHWFGIRKCASLWWNVDSKLPRPMLIATARAVGSRRHLTCGPTCATTAIDATVSGAAAVDAAAVDSAAVGVAANHPPRRPNEASRPRHGLTSHVVRLTPQGSCGLTQARTSDRQSPHAA